MLANKYLVTVVDVFVISKAAGKFDFVFIFMELMEGGDLAHYLKRKRCAADESTAGQFYLQIGAALQYVHASGFAHRDLKCDNVVLNKAQTVAKITDFGFTRRVIDDTGNPKLSSTFCGSEPYLAPEVVACQPYDALISDVWSIGVVLFVLTNNRFPFDVKDKKKLYADQCAGRFTLARTLTPECKNFICRHLEPDEAKRANMRELLKDHWLPRGPVGRKASAAQSGQAE